MASSSELRRLFFAKGFSGICTYSISGKWSNWCTRFCRRGMSTAAKTLMLPSTVEKNNLSPSPLLMLPPVFEAGGVSSATMKYKLYSLAENRVLTLSTEKSGRDTELTGTVMLFRGSSLGGWLFLLHPHTLDLFLYNPISRRRIRLPPFHGPSDYRGNLPNVFKAILSCSPDGDQQKCVVVNLYHNEAMSFCCPLSSNEWTWFGSRSQMGYLDCVYSTTHQAFLALTKTFQLESWDLASGTITKKTMGDFSTILEYSNKGKDKKSWRARDEVTCVQEYRLVVAGEDLLVVNQYLMVSVNSDGLYVDFDSFFDPDGSDGWDDRELPYVTIDFDVYKYDPEDGHLKYVEGSSLGGWAIFIGFHSHSMAVYAADIPGLKANSIYFTDTSVGGVIEHEKIMGGHDIGIFNYEDKTVSPCYYPCDPGNLKKIFPAPMWFFPDSLLI